MDTTDDFFRSSVKKGRREKIESAMKEEQSLSCRPTYSFCMMENWVRAMFWSGSSRSDLSGPAIYKTEIK